MEKDSDKLLNANIVTLLVCAFAFMSSFYVLLPVLPPYVLSIGGTESHVGLIIGAFALSALLFRPVVGAAIDAVGRKGFIVLGALIFTCASAGYGFARSVALLLGVRVFHGVGMAAFQTAALTLVVDSVPDRRRGEAIGIYGISSNLAMVAGPALGSILLAATSFGAVFKFSALLAAVSVIVALVLKEHAGYRNRGPEYCKFGPFCREALLPSFAIFAVMLTYGATLSFVPLLITQEHLASKSQVALFFSVYAAVLIAARAPAGRISDKKGRLAAALPGMVLVGAAMACLAIGLHFAIVLFGAALYGVGMALAQPALTASAVDYVPESRRGSAMGTFSAAFELGIGLGAVAFGMLAGAVGYRQMFAAAGATAALAATVYSLLEKRRRDALAPSAATLSNADNCRSAAPPSLRDGGSTQ